ncbi:hypothetical protein ACJJTC_002469 [Scirpophaga incertulas]
MSGVEYRMPTPLNLDNLNEIYPQWKRFQASFNIFLLAAGLNKVTETRKAAIFLNCIGRSAQDLYFNTLKNPDKEKLEDIVEIFENYFKPKNNEIINTFHFNQRKQQDGENFDAFYSDLRKIAQNCDFESFFERMLRDRIIHGIQDRHVQQKLLEKKELTLEQTVDICRTSELSKEHVKIITEQQTSLHDVDAVQAKQPAFQHNITKAKEWNEMFMVESKNITFKCDTGAQINVLSLTDLKKIVDDDNPQWSETKLILEAFGGTRIKPGVGEFEKPLKLNIRPGAEPVVKPPRRVPNALLTRLRES